MTLPTGPEGNPNPASPEVPKETTALTKSNPYGFPRRIQMEKWVPAERAIHEAVQIVEGMGADVRLTDAVCLLGAARVRVADFVDGVEGLRTLAVQQRTIEHHASSQPASEPPECKNCGYPRSEHHVGEGWCLHGMIGEDATTYKPALPDSDTRLKELLKDFAESLERTGGANPTWLARGPEGVSEARAAIESFFAQQEARIRELTEKVEQTQAAFQASRNHYEPLVASLSSQIVRRHDELEASFMEQAIERLRFGDFTDAAEFLQRNFAWQAARRLSNPDTPK